MRCSKALGLCQLLNSPPPITLVLSMDTLIHNILYKTTQLGQQLKDIQILIKVRMVKSRLKRIPKE